MMGLQAACLQQGAQAAPHPLPAGSGAALQCARVRRSLPARSATTQPARSGRPHSAAARRPLCPAALPHRLQQLAAEWLQQDASPESRQEIEQLVAAEDAAGLEERLGTRLQFGAPLACYRRCKAIPRLHLLPLTKTRCTTYPPAFLTMQAQLGCEAAWVQVGPGQACRALPRLSPAVPLLSDATRAHTMRWVPCAATAGYNRMNAVTVQQTTQGLIRYLQQAEPDRLAAGGVVIGFDGRHHSREFAAIAAAACAAVGVPVWLFSQLVPTPFVPAAVQQLVSGGRRGGCQLGELLHKHMPAALVACREAFKRSLHTVNKAALLFAGLCSWHHDHGIPQPRARQRVQGEAAALPLPAAPLPSPLLSSEACRPLRPRSFDHQPTCIAASPCIRSMPAMPARSSRPLTRPSLRPSKRSCRCGPCPRWMRWLRTATR